MSDLKGWIAQINSLEEGKGLQYLLNEAYRIFGNPSLLFNMEYELIASCENIVTDDFLWNEIVENGVFSTETIEFFKSEEFQDTVAGSKTIALLTSANIKYDRFYGRVFNSDRSTVADFIMVACHVPFDEDTPAAVEAFCEKLTIEISSMEFYQQYGVLYHEKMMRKLLDKNKVDKIIFSDHVANLYEGLKTNLFVAVADASKCNSTNSSLGDFRDLFKKTQAEFKYAVYSDYIVILVSTEYKALNVNRDLNKLITLFEYNNIYAGVSGRFDNLFYMREHYDDAVNVLKLGLKTNSSRRVFLYNNNRKNKS